MTAIPVAYYAPLKSPDDPTPSGDRTMARLLRQALAKAGLAPMLASQLRTYDGRGDSAAQTKLRQASQLEADRLVKAYQKLPPEERPRLWFTYHVYYKAPDWIGPDVARRLAIPYVVAEGSRAGKRAAGAWALAHAGAEVALDAARIILVMTDADREALSRLRPDGQQLVDLPPFIDVSAWPDPPAQRREPGDPLRLLAVAMMRDGDKLASYALLAEAFDRLNGCDPTLDLVGDGPAAAQVRALFAPFGDRVRWHGRVDDAAVLARIYRDADLLVWPGVNEAYGMVFLEAQACGCPVVAGAYGGIPAVVRDGVTGVLTRPGDPQAFAAAVEALCRDPDRRQRMGDAARRFVQSERSLEGAAAILRRTLMPLVSPA